MSEIDQSSGEAAPLALILALVARGATAGLIFLLIALAARQLDVQTFGTFSVLYSTAGMLALVAAGGQQILLIRAWNEYTEAVDAARLKGAFIFSAIVIGIGLLICSLGLFCALGVWYTWSTALAVTTYMACLAIVLCTAHLVRAAVGIEAGDGLANFMTLLVPIVYLATHALLGEKASLLELFFLFPLGSLMATALHGYMVRKRLRQVLQAFWNVAPVWDTPAWSRRSIKLWLFNALEAINQFADVLLLGVLLNPEVAGAYFVLTRLANTFLIAEGAVQFFASRHIPRLFYAREFQQLEQHLFVIAAGCAALIPAGLIAMWVAGPAVLALLEPQFIQYSPLLLVLSFGTAALLGAGASGVLLTFSGHEGRIGLILGVTVVVRLIGFVVVVPSMQVFGAAMVTASSFTLMAAAVWYWSWKLTGFDGSVVRLLRVRGRLQAATASGTGS